MSSVVYRNIVNGVEYKPENEEFIEIKSPIDESVLGNVTAMSQEDVDFVMESTKKTQKYWATVNVHEKEKFFIRQQI